MRLSIYIEACDQGADSERTYSSLLSVLLLGLCHKFGDVFDWWAIVVVKSIALAFDASFVCQDTAISSEARICHMNVVIKLNNFLNSSTFLQFGDCFFLV